MLDHLGKLSTFHHVVMTVTFDGLAPINEPPKGFLFIRYGDHQKFFVRRSYLDEDAQEFYGKVSLRHA